MCLIYVFTKKNLVLVILCLKHRLEKQIYIHSILLNTNRCRNKATTDLLCTFLLSKVNIILCI